jgi:hypothetical protein
LTRFLADPHCTLPDTKAWAKQLGIRAFDRSCTGEALKDFAKQLLVNSDIIEGNNLINGLTTYLGDGSASSAINLIEHSKIEIVHIDRLNDWLKFRWNIESTTVENKSASILRAEDLDATELEWLSKACAQDMILYEYITQRMSETDSASIVGGAQRTSFDAPSKTKNSSNTSRNVLSPEDVVTSLYRAILGRDPDSAGLTAHAAIVRNGSPLELIVRRFLEAADFTRRAGK